MSKHLDVICIGRVAVDFYAQQIGSRLEDVSSMAKYFGGSSGNVAYGTARQGLKSAMLARVGNDHMGRFLKEELDRVGCSSEYLITDHDRLTALAVLGIEDQETFPLIFYRDDCADMALCPDDIDEEPIASSRLLHITGTHFSTPTTDAACRKAIAYARKNNTRTSLDIDYRPVLWGLTGKAEGENRFIANKRVTEHLQSIIPLFDLIVGTEEELHIAGGSTNTLQALKNVRALSSAVIVLKRGELGASVYTGAIPNDLNGGINGCGVRIKVMNVLGAGDAFMSGLLRGYVRNESWEQNLKYANACGALVVSRHGCAPAMPSTEELDYYLEKEQSILRPDLDDQLNYLHRVTCRDVKWPELNVLAFDHRRQFVELCEEVGANPEKITHLKRLILEAARIGADEMKLNGQAGVLCDDTYGQDTLNAVTGKGWWIGRPVEEPGSRPLKLEKTDNLASRLITWPKEHVVKCLCFYHPDDNDALRHEQEVRIQTIYEATVNSGHEFLLELIPPAGSDVNDETLARSMQRFYDLDVRPDWWKVPAPSRTAWCAINQLIKTRAPHCRGVILLGLGASEKELQQGFNNSAGFDICKGFMVGRTIFGQPAKDWLAGDINDQTAVQRIANNYIRLIQLWRKRQFKT